MSQNRMVLRAHVETVRAVTEALRAAETKAPQGWRENLSDYWQEQIQLADVKPKADGEIVIDGWSGFYFPVVDDPVELRRKLLLPVRHFYRRLEIQRALDWIEARADTLVVDELSRRCWGLSIPQPADPVVSHFGTPIRGRRLSQRFVQSLHSMLKFLEACREAGERPDVRRYVEIGPGTGLMASIVKQLWPKATIVLIDLPNVLVNSSVFLSNCFPQSKRFFYDGAAPQDFDAHDFVFLPHFEAGTLPSDWADLAWNEHSMQEMTPAILEDYFRLLRRAMRPQGLFFCSNRVEKEMNGKPLRFAEYPWRLGDRHLLDAPDDFVGTCPYMTGRKLVFFPAWETCPDPVHMRVSRLAKERS